MENNIIEKVITGELEMAQAAIAKKYQTIRQDDMSKLKLDIVATGKFTDPIYLTPEHKIIDGWKRLIIIKELYQEDFKLTVEPTVIIIDGSERQEEIYISKNVMVNRYKKSWLAIIASENYLPRTRKIAAARRGIKQKDGYDACADAGTVFGISGKLVQQADDVLKSQYGEFLRGKIRTDEITVTNAYELITKQLESILNDMKNGKTYRQAMNDFMRDGQGTRQHERFQKREELKNNNLLEYQKNEIKLATSTLQAENESVLAPISTLRAVTISTMPKIEIKTQAESTQSHFVGALSEDCSPEFKIELEQLIKKYMPNSYIVFVQNKMKLQQIVHENNLNYTDIVKAA